MFDSNRGAKERLVGTYIPKQKAPVTLSTETSEPPQGPSPTLLPCYNFNMYKYEAVYLEILSDKAIFLGQPCQTVVRLAHASDSSTNGVHLAAAGHPPCLRIHLSNVDLNRGVVLRVDYSVAR